MVTLVALAGAAAAFIRDGGLGSFGRPFAFFLGLGGSSCLGSLAFQLACSLKLLVLL